MSVKFLAVQVDLFDGKGSDSYTVGQAIDYIGASHIEIAKTTLLL